jgi:CPA1 family monovalent cation:H+ antiporter
MTLFQISAVLLCFAAFSGYINHRFIKLPDAIGQMACALVVSLVAFLLHYIGWIDTSAVKNFLEQINFTDLLLHGMLSFLLFAGALHINMTDLRKVKWSVGMLSTFGVLLATFIIGTLIWYVSAITKLPLTYPYALLFGALIAPTDPIAVLSILKKSNVSKKMYLKIGAESLFNDGIAIVLFITILETALSGQAVTPMAVTTLLIREAIGGILLGGILGWGVYRLLRSLNDYKVEVLLTLAVVTGGYAIAEYLHVSAPIFTVTAGLIIGNHRIEKGPIKETHKRLCQFWELIDETLNAILFVLIGLKVFTLTINIDHLFLGCMAIIIVLLGRWISVALPIFLVRMKRKVEHGTIRILSWGGLRGGLSIAMALSLPHSPEKSIIVPVTYIVVLFSILVQGLTFPYAIKAITGKKKAHA